MFAFFGLGIAEMVVLAVIALLMVGVPIIIIRSVNSAGRTSTPARMDEIAELRKEVRWLSEEVERLKRQIEQPPAPGAIKSDS